MFKEASSMRVIVFAVALVGLAATAPGSSAASLSVQLACASDYYAYCAKHDPDSPGVRSCMRSNGPRLSRSCLSALVAAGEVSKSEIERRKVGAK